MGANARLFLDTSALFSGLWSESGGARALLQLGEAGLIQLIISQDVLDELDRVIRKKAPEVLGTLALVLDRARVVIAPRPKPAPIADAERWTGHAGDARIVAAAQSARADYLVTLDRAHLLDNPLLKKHLAFPVDTPGSALAWLRARWARP